MPSGDPVDVGMLLFGKSRRQLLTWLFGQADGRFYLRQLARQAGVAQGAIHRQLTALVRAGLVTRSLEGRQVYFQANRESPVFSDLQRLLRKLVVRPEPALPVLTARVESNRAAPKRQGSRPPSTAAWLEDLANAGD